MNILFTASNMKSELYTTSSLISESCGERISSTDRFLRSGVIKAIKAIENSIINAVTVSSFRLNTIGSLLSLLPVLTVFSLFISDSGMRKSLWIQKYREPFPSRG